MQKSLELNHMLDFMYVVEAVHISLANDQRGRLCFLLPALAFCEMQNKLK